MCICMALACLGERVFGIISACGKKYEATWASTMNARLCRLVYSMRYAEVAVQKIRIFANIGECVYFQRASEKSIGRGSGGVMVKMELGRSIITQKLTPKT
jgi:hypothetical protein